ncbi:MAG: ribosome biogenesis factor YjgA [Deltaproteobacteria bacterium]|nr:ribosome biogenesis factor YjgA [Deltaproteobacteria bacterium]
MATRDPASSIKHFDDEGENEKKLDALNVDENGRFLNDPPPKEPRVEKKRRAIELENLGEALVKLKPGQLARVPMPDDLRVAVVDAQRLAGLGKAALHGHRRQLQFIGKIMRTVDAVPILASLEDLLTEGTMSSVAFQRADQWREKLIGDGDAALSLLCTEHPEVDRTALRQLVRAAAKERETQQATPEAERGPSTNQKKLFRSLRLLFEPAVSESSNEEES